MRETEKGQREGGTQLLTDKQVKQKRQGEQASVLTHLG